MAATRLGDFAGLRPSVFVGLQHVLTIRRRHALYAGTAGPQRRRMALDVMTQNQYLGADLGPVLSAANIVPFDPTVFNVALVEALQKLAAAQPAARVAALAADIAQRRPEVVGLQEAHVFACLPFPGVPEVPGMGCDDPSGKQASTDPLANTEKALRGQYRTVGKVTSLPTPAGPVTVAIERGCLAVDAAVRGQAYELYGTAMATWDGQRKRVVMGDFSSAPGDVIPVPPYPADLGPGLPTKPPYDIFALGGFADTWLLRAPPSEGLTCCQDEDLAKRKSQLYERIDLIFTMPAPTRVVDMMPIGATMCDKTRPPGHGGLWPSDHASVAARSFFD